MEKVVRLPLFPLNTVLFPGQMLPLHIFEPRYRTMINQCIERETPFGVVLIQEGREVGADAVPHRVGTSARITDTERLEDGRMHIVIAGEARFRILQLYHDLPYLTGDVVAWPWVEDQSLAASPAMQVRQRLERYLAILARSVGDLMEVDNIPTQPIALGCLVAIALQVAMHEKQDLLNSPTVASLLDKEIDLLQREISLLLITRGIPTRLVGQEEIFTWNN